MKPMSVTSVDSLIIWENTLKNLTERSDLTKEKRRPRVSKKIAKAIYTWKMLNPFNTVMYCITPKAFWQYTGCFFSKGPAPKSSKC